MSVSCRRVLDGYRSRQLLMNPLIGAIERRLLRNILYAFVQSIPAHEFQKCFSSAMPREAVRSAEPFYEGRITEGA